jgi:hypothetical protein
MAIDSTLGGTAANSYVSQSAASVYFSNRLDVATWTEASSANKDAALMMATTRLDAESYTGLRVLIDQRLQWPRNSVYDRDGVLLSSSTIPLVVQQATFEYALALLREPTLLGDSGLEGFINIKLGSLDVTPRATIAAKLPAFVKRLLTPVLLGGGEVHVVRA